MGNGAFRGSSMGGITKPVTDMAKSSKAGRIKSIKLKVKFNDKKTAAQSAQKPSDGTAPR